MKTTLSQANLELLNRRSNSQKTVIQEQAEEKKPKKNGNKMIAFGMLGLATAGMITAGVLYGKHHKIKFFGEKIIKEADEIKKASDEILVEIEKIKENAKAVFDEYLKIATEVKENISRSADVITEEKDGKIIKKLTETLGDGSKRITAFENNTYSVAIRNSNGNIDTIKFDENIDSMLVFKNAKKTGDKVISDETFNFEKGKLVDWTKKTDVSSIERQLRLENENAVVYCNNLTFTQDEQHCDEIFAFGKNSTDDNLVLLTYQKDHTTRSADKSTMQKEFCFNTDGNFISACIGNVEKGEKDEFISADKCFSRDFNLSDSGQAINQDTFTLKIGEQIYKCDAQGILIKTN